jgi:hypothetical protein
MWNPVDITLVGHSLGSVILFEILSHADLPSSQCLPFFPKNYIAMGSPIAVFGNTSEDDPDWFPNRVSSMRINECFRNIFHPNDPVAYKLEPLLTPCPHFAAPIPVVATAAAAVADEDNEDSVALSLSNMTVGGGRVGGRVENHVYPLVPVFIDTVSGEDFLNVKYVKVTKTLKDKTKQVEEASRGLLSNALNFIGGKQDGNILSSWGKSGGANKTPKRTFCQKCFDMKLPQRYIGSETPVVVEKSLFRKHRIDFSIQQSDVEVSMSEYISALKAHNSYYGHADVINFIQNLIDDQDQGGASKSQLTSGAADTESS